MDRSQYRIGGAHPQGFAKLSQEERSRIASMGGKEAHRLGLAHRWSSEEARAAGQIGGSRRKGPRRKRQNRA